MRNVCHGFPCVLRQSKRVPQVTSNEEFDIATRICGLRPCTGSRPHLGK
jgi:hypothetical protein